MPSLTSRRLINLPKTPVAIIDSDDESASSTIPTTTITKTTTTTTPTAPSIKKRVRFEPSKNVYHEDNNSIEDVDPSELWCTKLEYRQYKVTSLYMARQITKLELENDGSYSRLMYRVYAAACNSDSDDAFDYTRVLSKQECQQFVRWAVAGTSRLGLERWAVKAIANDRLGRRQDLLKAVLKDAACNPEDMSKASQEHSRYAVLFAQVLGQVTAQAVAQEQEDTRN